MNIAKKCQPDAIKLWQFSVAVACLLCVAAGCSNTATEQAADPVGNQQQSGGDSSVTSAAEATGTVTLTIDYGDPDRPVRTIADIPLSEADSIADVMAGIAGENGSQQANGKIEGGASEQGKLRFTSRGSGDRAFLISIDGIENEGASQRNWMYYVNEEKADCGFGVYPLKDGDSVVWKFKKYEE